MKRRCFQPLIVFVIPACLMIALAGCQKIHLKRALYQPPAPPAPLGSTIDQINQIQETNAEASDFVVYQHEFDLGTRKLNMAGKDHVKEIAQRMLSGQSFPVIIERSMTSVRPGDKHKYAVHPNPALDMQRRDVIVRSLTAMGVLDAEERVVVAPALTPGYTGPEAERAYERGMSDYSDGYGSFGFGSFNGFGGYGGFGY